MQEGLLDHAPGEYSRLAVVPCWRTLVCFSLLAYEKPKVCCSFVDVLSLCSCHVSHEQSLQCAVVRPAADEARRAASLRVTVGRGAEVTLGEVGNRAVGFDPEREWREGLLAVGALSGCHEDKET
jgi:hypothetical protein